MNHYHLQLIELTKRLCDIYSPLGQEEGICNFLLNWAKQYLPSYICKRIENSIIILPINLSPNKKNLLFVGHTDTVPAQKEFIPTLETSETLEGLGTSDMKGGDAVLLLLLKASENISLNYNLSAILYEKEEGAFLDNGMKKIISANALPKADLAFVFEPTNNSLELGCMGTLQAKVTIIGKPCHSARPWLGDNAIYKAIPFIETLSKRTKQTVTIDGLDYHNVVSVTQANTSNAKNVIPGTFILNVNYRFSPDRNSEEVINELSLMIQKIGTLETDDLALPAKPCTKNAILESFSKRYQIPLKPKQAWTDVSQLTACGIDAVNFGPGQPEMAHTLNESIQKSTLLQSFDWLFDFLSDLNT